MLIMRCNFNLISSLVLFTYKKVPFFFIIILLFILFNNNVKYYCILINVRDRLINFFSVFSPFVRYKVTKNVINNL